MQFLTEDFLLKSATSKVLYHKYAAKCPIYDYHCHIDPKDIWEDKRFSDLAELWLGGDHYKWRIMRSNGVPEKFITGGASGREKFQKFAEALPRCAGNPMYHWCHLELKNYFGYEGVLNGETAEEVWQLALKKLAEPKFSARGLIEQSNVAMVGTTDDPVSDLKYHKLLADSDFKVKVCPSYRPDKAINIHKAEFPSYIVELSRVSGIDIKTVDDVKRALTERMEFFRDNGCRAADHGIDYIMYREADEATLDAILARGLRGETLTIEDREAYQTAILMHCAREYNRLGLVMQLHFSCLRNPNKNMFDRLGADVGFDTMCVTDSSVSLCALMDALEQKGELPRTILYSLNPADNAWIGTVLGAFQGEGVRGKIQHGSAWWFNDHKTGMQDQMISLANLGILGNFVGMLTDSRSLLSYARHEYFRRILCNLLGEWVENGEYPDDIEYLGSLVEDICSNNAKEYFNL